MVQPPAPGPSLWLSSSSHTALSHLLLLESVNDLIVICLISTIVLFSVISLVFIIHFHFKSQESQALQNFNSLCSVRVLLVTFISLWALAEFLRLPFTRRYLISHLTPDHQANICRLHIVLSFGLFEPGFLVTLLFLLSFSIKKKDPNDTFGSAVGVVLALCLPVLTLQIYFVFFPNKTFFSELLWKSHVTIEDFGGESLVLCVYPLFGTIIFGVFGVVYALYFFCACCKVVALVINRGLRIRLYALMLSVVVTVPLQVVLLVVSTLWNPVNPSYNGITLVMFLIVLLCAAVGEGILVIRPILDALAVGRALVWWKGSCREPIVFEDNDRVKLAAAGSHAIDMR
ncbi:hypothetical protein ACHQM5_000052 [Ranunculus cassubicifolius]